MIKVVFPFDAVTHSQLRKIRPRGFWRGTDIGWEFPFTAAQALTALLAKRFVVKDDLTEWLKLSQAPLPKLPSHCELIANADLYSELNDGRTPFPHQRAGARWLLCRRGALLADEMGLGKTLTVLLAARAMVRLANVHVLVIAPLGLHDHWLKEASALHIDIDLHSWAALPKNLPASATLLVVDEAHFAQSLKAKRSQALLKLSRHPSLMAIWMITGTPMKNGRPVELYPLLAAIQHPLAEDQRAFEKDFCNGHWQKYGFYRIWNCHGATNLNELRILLSSLILKRSKDNCFGLLAKIRQEHLVSLTKAEAIGFDHRIRLVLDEYRLRVEQGLVQSNAESLTALLALRQISSEYKLPAVTNLVNQLIEQGQSVVLFSSFIEPLKLLNNHLDGFLLTGENSFKERELAVNSFQKGQKNLLLTTYRTGGLGYTLHRAKHVILLDRPWTPGDVTQAEDRCHRIGMKGTLTSHWFKLGFVDELVDSLIASKNDNINEFIHSELFNA